MIAVHAGIAIRDIVRSFRQFSLAWFLAWEDIRQRYVRTLLGPLWIVISTGIWFGVMGFVMSNLFRQNLHDYMPFMVCGLLMWVLISTSLSESSTILLAAAGLITSFNIPIFIHYLRFTLRNSIIFFHNLLILLIVLLIFPPKVTEATLLVIPGLLLNMLILTSVAVLLSLMHLRYRDTNVAVASALQILPFITPIFWDKAMLEKHKWIADINPFYHMIDIVRAPVLGEYPSANSWVIASLMGVVLFFLACGLFVRYRQRIIFWL